MYSCTVWVTPIREQLSIAITCKQLGAGNGATVNCTTRPLDLTPSHVMSLSYRGTAAIVVSHGYTLASERCDDPWEAPRQLLDHAGLLRTYHCELLLAKAGQPIFDARAILSMGLALRSGGWQIHILDVPGLQGGAHSAAASA